MGNSKKIKRIARKSASIMIVSALMAGTFFTCAAEFPNLDLIVSAADSSETGTQLINKSYVNSVSLKLGETVRIKGKAEGGSGTYLYSYYFKRTTSANWNLLGTEFSTAKSAIFKPVSSGIFDVRVDIKDSDGTVVSKNIKVEASSGEFENISALNRNVINDLSLPIRLYGLGVGGSGNYSYAYYFKRSVNEKWNKIGTEFGKQKEVRLYPTAFAGYDIMIKVKDDETRKIVSKNFTVNPGKTESLSNESFISDTAVKVGQTVKLTGKASGGKAPYTYTYQFKRTTNAKWNNIGNTDTTSLKALLTPTAAAEYDVKITVKDADNNKSEKTFTLSSFNIVNESEIDKEVINLGNEVTVTAKTSGGSGNSKYSYYYKKNTDQEWTLNGTEYSDETYSLIKPEETGEYDIMVKVKDDSGLITEKTFSITVNDELSNLSTIDRSVIKKGNTVTITALAQGGTGEYTYSYYYQQLGSLNWYSIGDENTSAITKTFSPSSAVTYKFKVIVTDSIGDQAEKSFVVTVKSSGSDELPIIPAT